MIFAGILLGILICALLWSPFFVSALAGECFVETAEELERLLSGIQIAYVQEEIRFRRGELSRREWENRAEFLLGRYRDHFYRWHQLHRSEEETFKGDSR